MHVAFQGVKWIHTANLASIVSVTGDSASPFDHLEETEVLRSSKCGLALSTCRHSGQFYSRFVIHTWEVDSSISGTSEFCDNRNLAAQRGSYMVEQYFIVQRFSQELYRSCP